MAEVQDLLETASKRELEMKLLESCRDGHTDVVVVLLSKDVNVDARDEKGSTGLILASMHGREDIVRLLLQCGADINIRDDCWVTALIGASKNGHDGIVQVLIDQGAGMKKSKGVDGVGVALMRACENGHERVVNILVQSGVTVNASDNKGISALMLTCMNGHEDVAKVLIERGANLNTRASTSGMTALMKACANGHDGIVKLLLARGASLKIKSCCGRNALLWACQNGHGRVLEVLRRYKADANVCDQDGTTALMKAFQMGHFEVGKMLVDYGACVNASDKHGQTALTFACKLEKGKHVEFLLENGAMANTSALMSACYLGHDKCVELLLGQGLDVNACNAGGETALMKACSIGLSESNLNRYEHNHESLFREDEVEENRYERIAELLLQSGANTDAQDSCGRSAVMVAVMADSVKCLKKLLSVGPNLDLKDMTQQTVFSYAMRMTNTNTVCLRMLLGEGLLLTVGRLKPVHKNVNSSQFSLASLGVTMEIGVFEWEWCRLAHYKQVSLSALDAGIYPGKLKYDSTLTLSPLVVSFLQNDTELIKTFLKRHYYFPADYRTLLTDMVIRERLSNSSVLDDLIFRPRSLQTLSFLVVSESIHHEGSSWLRGQRVESLPIPDKFKRRLNFKMD